MVTEYNLNVINTHDKAIWSNFITKHRYNNILFTVPYIERIIVDFSRCGFLEPYHLTSLSCLIEEYSHYKVKISFKFLEYSPLTQYLRDINFLNYWLSAVKDQQNYIPTERKTCLGLWKISEEMIYSYTSLAKNYYETNYIVDKDLLPLATALTELFMNISDHSSSIISGFCITQFFTNTRKLKFSVCDFGIGIPTSVNRFLNNKGQNSLPHNMCLEKAFEIFTTQSLPRNRGFGLDTIKTIIQANFGELRVVSNNGIFSVNGAFIKSYLVNQHFGGTHFEVVLDVDNLKLKTFETEDFDFQ